MVVLNGNEEDLQEIQDMQDLQEFSEQDVHREYRLMMENESRRLMEEKRGERLGQRVETMRKVRTSMETVIRQMQNNEEPLEMTVSGDEKWDMDEHRRNQQRDERKRNRVDRGALNTNSSTSLGTRSKSYMDPL